jgi:uncharacterized membrane protein YccC
VSYENTPLDFNPRSDTSRLANVYSLPNRAGDRDRALRALIDAGERGMNDFELADAVSRDGGPRRHQSGNAASSLSATGS